MIKLHSSGLGCHFRGVIFNSLMYADDLVLMSASLSDLQLLVNLCTDSLAALLLKCFCIRIWKRFASQCMPLSIDSEPIRLWKKLDILEFLLKLDTH